MAPLVKDLPSYIKDTKHTRIPSVLVRLAELVLTLNNFSFDGEHYQQINGVALGTKMGRNYANLFVGFVEKQIFEQYTDPIPDYHGRYIDDCLGTASCSRVELERFTLLIIFIQHSSSHGRSVRPVYHS
jgi:hypothetical protein